MHNFTSPIAQSVERRTVNPQVPGSSPGRGAKIHNGTAFRCAVFIMRKLFRQPETLTVIASRAKSTARNDDIGGQPENAYSL